MAATVTNLIAGPGDLYAGAFGASEPAETSVGLASAPSAPFVDAGGTQDGVNLVIQQDYFQLEVDQLVDVPESRISRRGFQIQANMAEPTLENLAIAINSTGTVTTIGTGATTVKKLEPNTSTSITQPTYRCLIFDGWAPDMKRRRFTGRKMLSTENIEFAYKKADQTIFTVTWTGHYVSSSIKPWTALDAAPTA